MRRWRVGLVQVNGSFSNQSYLPYSVGLLQGYAEKYTKIASDLEFLLPLFKWQPIGKIVDHLHSANIIGFGLYVWNEAISLEIVRRLKRLNPHVLIILGGPQVPGRAEAFLREHPYADVVVHGAGELVFTAILDQAETRDWSNIAGVSYLTVDGDFVHNAEAPRLRDLDLLPSPYLSGVFDRLLAALPNEMWTAPWETNRGCPFGCTYCDWGSNTATKVNRFSMERLRAEMDWFSDHHIDFIYCCDANFGILPRDHDIATHFAELKSRTGFPKIFSVQNTKNATERSYSTQKVLSDAGLSKGVSLAMQSLNPETLKNIKRDNILADHYDKLLYRFALDHIDTYSELIVGLPGDTYDSFADSVDSIISKGQHNRIRFNNLSILPNAEMGNVEYQQRHKMTLVRTPVAHVYGEQECIEDVVQEFQILCVANETMDASQWRAARSYGWMSDFLHFDKTAQIPFITLHYAIGAHYREMIELFLGLHDERFPILSDVAQFFKDKAQAIQDGDVEYCFLEQHLSTYWKADEAMVIRIVTGDLLDAFYAEMLQLLREFVAKQSVALPDIVLEDAIRLNKALFRRPYLPTDTEISLSTTVASFYRNALGNVIDAIRPASSRVVVKRSVQHWSLPQEWCREVVWYGNRTGAYFYDFEFYENLPGS